MRHIVAGSPGLYLVRASRIGCALACSRNRRFAACGSGRASRAYNYLNVDVNATYCRRAAARLSLLRARFAGRVLHCGYSVAKMSQPAARALASRFALRLCAAARRLARAVALALFARRFAARVPPSCSAVALHSLPASRAVARAPLLRRPLPAARGAVGGAALLRRSSPLRGSSPGLAAVAARRRAPCPTSTSVLASLYPCQEST